MIWLTWRQHRGQVIVLAAGLALLGAVLLLTGAQMHGAFRDTGLERCLERQGDPAFVAVPTSGCVDLGDQFAARFFNQRLLALVLFIVLPVLAGMFLGAPVIARELEQGTHQLVWTQGVSRTRWAVTKIALLAAILAVVSGAFALIVQWWFEPLDRATGRALHLADLRPAGHRPRRLRAVRVRARGPARGRDAAHGPRDGHHPGHVLRRSLRGRGVDPAALSPPAGPHLLACSATGSPTRCGATSSSAAAGRASAASTTAPACFIKGGQTICPGENVSACVAEFGRGAHNLEIYQPASRYWQFQGIETALFLALAVLLLAGAVWWVRRRLT